MTEPQTEQPAWTAGDLSDPHAVADKASRVRRMFAAIAPKYDLNNRLHSLGRDQAWRRTAVKLAGLRPGEVVLDVACGTGDLAEAFARARAGRVIGVDFTVPMLTIADRKASRVTGGGGAASLSYHAGDALRLPLADASVDVVSIAFGIRNVADPARAIGEFFRVLRPGGRLIVLEFSVPTNRLIRVFDRLYREKVMPVTAKWIARDRTGAYRYLPRSVDTFLDREGMKRLMGEAGFVELTERPVTFGIAVCYRGVKP